MKGTNVVAHTSDQHTARCGGMNLQCSSMFINVHQFWPHQEQAVFSNQHPAGFLKTATRKPLTCSSKGHPKGAGSFFPRSKIRICLHLINRFLVSGMKIRALHINQLLVWCELIELMWHALKSLNRAGRKMAGCIDQIEWRPAFVQPRKVRDVLSSLALAEALRILWYAAYMCCINSYDSMTIKYHQ